ncbi:MAG: hypothetical protein HOO00_03535 [Rhodospirillaceae bacterium]|nr:hypothetical protein [Rhodospirillaceae bacterium]MBT5658874.1 hypothetical protein [Rhodospirillaceae bacterium]MBT5752659.1 hypothetical protein [Rhodospirillaceae bacterium]
MLALPPGLDREADPGSNWPGRVCSAACPALAFRLMAFCSVFAFARSLAFALVMLLLPF